MKCDALCCWEWFLKTTVLAFKDEFSVKKKEKDHQTNLCSTNGNPDDPTRFVSVVRCSLGSNQQQTPPLQEDKNTAHYW